MCGFKKLLNWIACLLVSCLLFSCGKDHEDEAKLFQLVPASQSSVQFNNTLSEDEKFNIIEYLYFYNGGGVSIGDINNDGLADIYFVSNQGSNTLYLNEGNFKFKDITQSAGVQGSGNWKTGTVMADVNGDGYLDIYSCGVGNYKGFTGTNQLYINNHDLTFTEMSKEYGLDFTGFSTQAAFFDYDRDGDLDMYLLNHSVHSVDLYGKASLRLKTDSLAGDRLYQNQLIQTGKPFFKDVTAEAGIYSSRIGYGLGIGVSDLNNDGLPDLYVSNDFYENDYLYLNKGDGTFREVIQQSTGHTSRFSMGNDLADVNNDLWPDIFTTDMLPKDEDVIKTSAGEDSYEVYLFKLGFGYHKQVSRNAFQVNKGLWKENIPVFSDEAFTAGVAATDWSWSPLLVDFDGDGYKDLFVTSGIVRRPNDLDYFNFISSDSLKKRTASGDVDVLPWLSMMPEGKVSNSMFRNNHDATFENVSNSWGFQEVGYSNGSAIGDLDNDGDPDMVINNLNATASIYKNQSNDNKYITVELKDEASMNKQGVGAKVKVYSNNLIQQQELYPARGWCSSSSYVLTFGLGKSQKADSILVQWVDGTLQKFIPSESKNVIVKSGESRSMPNTVDQLLRVDNDVIKFKHKENVYNAFNFESLMPKMVSEEGPPMAVGDVNQDGIEDLFVGGARGQAGKIFTQNKQGSYSELISFYSDSLSEDTGASFFDADGDTDLDLVVVSGGQQELQASPVILPRLYINQGKGKFSKSTSFPEIYLHASCVRHCDFDADGDVDLFIGANVIPLLYGMGPMSYLLINDGKGNFRPSSEWLGRSRFDNPSHVRPGMVKDAVWTNVNSDKLPDLVLVGDWMPITILVQQPNHTFNNATESLGLDSTQGWWSSIHAEDFDKDGDIDLVAGNFGSNSRLSASKSKPLTMYLGDFDSNGNSDHILVYYNGDKSYPFITRDQLVKQLPLLKKKFLKYYNYRNVKLGDIITPVQAGNSAKMQVYSLASAFLENKGGKFEAHLLPTEAQLFPIYTIASDDINQDGHLDLIVAGNATAIQQEIGLMDAGLGLVLLGDSKGNFKPVSPLESGLYLRGNTRSLIKSTDSGSGKKRYIFGVNNDSVITFKSTH